MVIRVIDDGDEKVAVMEFNVVPGKLRRYLQKNPGASRFGDTEERIERLRHLLNEEGVAGYELSLKPDSDEISLSVIAAHQSRALAAKRKLMDYREDSFMHGGTKMDMWPFLRNM